MGVIAVVVTMGSVIYLAEGGENGFSSIPRSIYWAIVTVTTVGYGDMVPRTQADRQLAAGQACPACGVMGHDADALFCKRCAARL